MKKLFLAVMLCISSLQLHAAAEPGLLEVGWWKRMIPGLLASRQTFLPDWRGGSRLTFKDLYDSVSRPYSLLKDLKDPIIKVYTFLNMDAAWNVLQHDKRVPVALLQAYKNQKDLYEKITATQIHSNSYLWSEEKAEALVGYLHEFEKTVAIVFGAYAVEHADPALFSWDNAAVRVILDRATGEKARLEAGSIPYKAKYAREILSLVARAFPYEQDLGRYDSATQLYSWDKLKTWANKVMMIVHPDKRELDTIKARQFDVFFRAIAEEIRIRSRYILSIQQLNWEHFEFSVPSGAMSDAEAIEMAHRSFLFLRKVYDIASESVGADAIAAQDKIIDFCNAVLVIDQSAIQQAVLQAKTWQLTRVQAAAIQAMCQRAAMLYGAMQKEDQERSSWEKKFTALKPFGEKVQEGMDSIDAYLRCLDAAGVAEEKQEEKLESLFEIAGDLVKKQFSGKISDVVALCENKGRTILGGQQKTQWQAIHKVIFDFQDHQLLKRMKTQIAGTHDAGHAGSYEEVYTGAMAQQALAAIVSANPIYSLDSLFATFKGRYDQATWGSVEALDSKAKFDAAVDQLRAVVIQMINLLRAYTYLLAEDPFAGVVKDGKDGRPMPALKDTNNTALQKLVNKCAADFYLLQVVGFLGSSDGTLWITQSPLFSGFYRLYIASGKWLANFVNDCAVGTMDCEKRLPAVLRALQQAKDGITAQLADHGQFFDFFAQDFQTLAAAYCALPAAVASGHADHAGGASADKTDHGPKASEPSGAAYTMPAAVQAAMRQAQTEFTALAGFDWAHAGATVRRIQAQLYKKFEADMKLLAEGKESTVTIADIDSKGLSKVGDNLAVKRWLEAWKELLQIVASGGAADASAGKSGGMPVLPLLLELNQTLQILVAA